MIHQLALLNANINALHCLLTYGVEPSGCMVRDMWGWMQAGAPNG
jgi:hypothetical protein